MLVTGEARSERDLALRTRSSLTCPGRGDSLAVAALTARIHWLPMLWMRPMRRSATFYPFIRTRPLVDGILGC